MFIKVSTQNVSSQRVDVVHQYLFWIMQKTLRLVLGDQLNITHSWYKESNSDTTYVLMEVMQEQEYVMHHIQKILAFFAAMRNFAHVLTKAGHEVIYITLDDSDNQQSFDQNIKQLLEKHKITRFEYQLPDEYRLDEQLKTFSKSLTIETAVYDSEHFITGRKDVEEFFAGKKTYLMENFYRYIRKKLGILMNGAKPLGDQWNFDEFNRKKYDGKVPLQDAVVFDHDVSSLKAMIDKMGVKYFGSVDEQKFPWPLSRKEALQSLQYFCETLLPHFGTYEDAMLQEHATLFHARLSFALNSKMIAPLEVVSHVLNHYQQNKEYITLAQVEGFTRQIIGWREFMRGVYWAQMPEFATFNYFQYQRKLPKWFWDGNTKMNCLHKAIGASLQNAYAHHIQRLMVIGNFALLAGLNPDEVDAWYLGIYIDAIEWVEITNTRGMSQYADGGLIASKPYVSSAAYINKMSDYCKHCAYSPLKKVGEGACPFNSLYWNFYFRNSDKLRSNFRIGMMYSLMDKMDKTDLQKLVEQGEAYLEQIDDL